MYQLCDRQIPLVTVPLGAIHAVHVGVTMMFPSSPLDIASANLVAYVRSPARQRDRQMETRCCGGP